jgi:hypothetical protein
MDTLRIFTAEQVAELKRLKLLDAQIAELTVQIAKTRSLFEPAPQMAKVRSELDGLRESLDAAHKRLERWKEAKDKASFEAWMRLRAEAWGDGRETGDELATLIEHLLNIVASARTGVSSEQQRRHRTASPLPVAIIDTALFEGWVKATSTQTRRTYKPIKRSASPTSQFFQIVAICWQTYIGKADANPERAIKAYLKADSFGVTKRRIDSGGEGQLDPVDLGQQAPQNVRPAVLASRKAGSASFVADTGIPARVRKRRRPN